MDREQRKKGYELCFTKSIEALEKKQKHLIDRSDLDSDINAIGKALSALIADQREDEFDHAVNGKVVRLQVSTVMLKHKMPALDKPEMESVTNVLTGEKTTYLTKPPKKLK